ncbi:MAG: EpsG family protein [Bacteroidales bacterium]|jgi:hypothetical protein|nr:EpsG family protein [Bacteroidales bacterium]
MITLSILLFITIILILLLFIKKNEYVFPKLFLLIIYICLFIAVGLRGSGIDHDYINYLNSIYDNFTIFEPTYLLISSVIRQYGLPATILFLIYSFLGVGTKFYAIYKYSICPIISLLVYFSNFLLLHDFNQIRAGVASGLLLLAIPLLVQKRHIKYLIMSLIAISFHYASCIFLLLFFITNNHINKQNRILWGIIPASLLVFHTFNYVNILSILPIKSIQLKIEMYQSLQESGIEGFAEVHLFNLYFLFKYAIYIFFLIKYDFYVKKNEYFSILLKIYGFSLACFYFFSSLLPIVGYRISELLGIVEILLFPTLFVVWKENIVKKFSVVIYVFLLVGINIFYKKMIFL